MKTNRLKIGEKANDSRIITEADILDFARVSGDYNPIHVDKDKASKSIFGHQIAHGMLVASSISAILGCKYPGEGTIYLEQNLKFLKPVYIGDTCDSTVTVSEIINEEKGIYKLTTVVNNQHGEIVVDGYAVIKYIG